ncbi:hypothetical protein HDU76_006585 [Blyttiomyces sp. JEL0837]|nr:hypothetical protein HDU76_006585 [Blyttiomyces sp. JEL0837]
MSTNVQLQKVDTAEAFIKSFHSDSHPNNLNNLKRSCIEDVLAQLEDDRVLHNDLEDSISTKAYPRGMVDLYNSVLRARCLHQELDKAVKLFNEMIANGIKPNLESYTIIIDGLQRGGNQQNLRAVLDSLAFMGYELDLVLATIVIKRMMKLGDKDGALEILKSLKRRNIQPDVILYNTIIQAFGRMGDFTGIRHFYGELLKQDLKPDVTTFTSIIDACMKRAEPRLALIWFDIMCGNSNPYAEHVTPPSASNSSDFTLVPDLTCFSAIINGFVQLQDLKSALEWYHRMLDASIKPNLKTITSFVRFFCSKKDMNSAIDWFTQCAHLGLEPDHILYNTLIHGYCVSGDFKTAKQTLLAMETAGLKPSGITFAILIDSLLKSAKVDDALSIFNLMCDKGLEPSLHIYRVLLANLGHQVGWNGSRGRSRSIVAPRTQEATPGAGAPPPRQVHTKAIYHNDLIRIYESYRRSLRRMPSWTPPVEIYDAMIAHFTTLKDLESAQIIFQNAITDGCILDLSIVTRLARSFGREAGWRGIVNWAADVKLLLTTQSAVHGAKSQSAKNHGPFLPDFNHHDEISKTTAGNEGARDNNGISKLLNKTLLAAYPLFGFRGEWRALRRRTSPVEWMESIFPFYSRTLILRYDPSTRRHGIGLDLSRDKDVKLLWELVIDVQKYFAGQGFETIFSKASNSDGGTEITKDISKEFRFFCWIFIQHCEDNGLWDARQSCLAWLKEHGMHLDDGDYKLWRSHFECGHARIIY